MKSIKEIIAETEAVNEAFKKVNMSWVMETQYEHSGYFLNELVIDVERNLIKKQNEDLKAPSNGWVNFYPSQQNLSKNKF